MTDRLLISGLPGELRAARLRDGILADLVIQRDGEPSVTGSIYLGRVARIDRGMSAAFVEIGLARPGVLPLSEAPARSVSEGDRVLVRALREPGPDKGARLTAKLKNPPPDLDDLAARADPPALLVPGQPPLDRLLTPESVPDEILVDDAAWLRTLKDRLSAFGADRADRAGRARLATTSGSLFADHDVEGQIEALLEPEVPLPSGGALLIEPVRTLVAIDVNAGRASERDPTPGQALAVNLEAAAEIGSQLRLRALSGLIVIDFLALKVPGARQQVVKALRRALRDDPEPGRVFPMTPSGLVEMTRRRGAPALHEILTEPVGIGGTGRVKSAVTLAYEALRRVQIESAGNPAGRPAIHAAPRVLEALGTAVALAVSVVERRIGRPIRLVPASGLADKGFEVALD